MNNTLYRFSPIQNEEMLEKALEYITVQLQKLFLEVLKERLPISIIKVFPHYPEESDYLHSTIAEMGPEAPFSSDRNLYVQVDKEIKGNHITALGVRFVDPYRMQVGCGDYEVDDYKSYREKHINTSPFIREINSSEPMLEIWHPAFDVLGYIVQK